MGIHNSIQQKQKQNLNISNQMVQFLNILNLGRYELEEALESEAEANPVLDLEIEEDGVNWEKYLKKEKNYYDFDIN